MRNLLTLAMVAAGMIGVTMAPVRAEPVVVDVTAVCPMTGPGIVVCGAVGTVLHELVQVANGKEGFGPNGEIMRILATPVKIVDANIHAAERERGELAKVLRGTLGISWEDMLKHGLFGGPNSIFRKPFG